MVQVQDGQKAVGRHHRIEGTVQADGGSEVLVEGQEVNFGRTGSGRQWRTQGGGEGARGSGGRRSKQQCEGVGQTERTWNETRYVTEVE